VVAALGDRVVPDPDTGEDDGDIDDTGDQDEAP